MVLFLGLSAAEPPHSGWTASAAGNVWQSRLRGVYAVAGEPLNSA